MKVFNYIILMVVIILVFNFFGVSTPSSVILRIWDPDNPSAFAVSDFFTLTIDAIAALLIAAAVIGLYMRSSPESFILLGYTATLFILVNDLIHILIEINNQASWAAGITGLIFGPLIIGYIHAVVSWWGNKS